MQTNWKKSWCFSYISRYYSYFLKPLSGQVTNYPTRKRLPKQKIRQVCTYLYPFLRRIPTLRNIVAVVCRVPAAQCSHLSLSFLETNIAFRIQGWDCMELHCHVCHFRDISLLNHFWNVESALLRYARVDESHSFKFFNRKIGWQREKKTV